MTSDIIDSIQQNVLIHPTAIIDQSVKLSAGVCIGPYVTIGPNVVIGSDCKIEAYVNIHSNTTIGKRNHIYSYAVIGSDPQDLTYTGQLTYLEIGDDNIIREYVSINRGSPKEKLTKIGNNNCILAYSHIAHDCKIGNHVRLVNGATLGGHVQVDDYAIVGCVTPIHQFCRIGAFSLCRATYVTKDIMPCTIVTGFPCAPHGLNFVGLRRHGFDRHAIAGLKKAYRYLFMQGLPLQEAVQKLTELSVDCPQVKILVDFIASSKRGIHRKASRT